eukprot:TRINITY_DN1856_c0_g1_i2.p1 TRINITY_DN1856_c0_g1~~TRINITY_DN1856_c0_g1_i2.p1  ORF type:complete len:806 (-),score=215.08 TRINITY_DN1856_c0_g1_i2:792-3209(-)
MMPILSIAKRKRASNAGESPEEPSAKRANFGTPKFTSTPATLEVNNGEKAIVSSPDSGLPSSSSPGLKDSIIKARIAAAQTPDNSPRLGKKVPAQNKNVTSVNSTPKTNGSSEKILKGSVQQKLLKSILKPEAGTGKATPDSNSKLTPSHATPNRSVSFEPQPDFVESTLEKMKSHPVTSEQLKDLLGCILLNKGAGLILALEKLRDNLDKLLSNHSGMIEEVAKLAWAHQETDVAKAFQQFFLTLLSHHPFYSKTVLRSLLKQLTVKRDEGEQSEEGATKHFALVQRNLNRFVKVLLRNFPRERKELLKQMQINFPFYKGLGPKFPNYLAGILGLYDIMTDAAPDIFEIAIENLIKLDASITRDQLVQYHRQELKKDSEKKAQNGGRVVGGGTTAATRRDSESATSAGEEELDASSDDESDDDEENFVQLSDVDAGQCKMLDTSLENLLTFVKKKTFLVEEVKKSAATEKDDSKKEGAEEQLETFSKDTGDPMMQTFLKLFTTHILTSDKLNSVQFIVFFLVNQSKAYIKQFLNINLEIFKSVNQASIIRQSAINHYGGFLCRSLEVGPKTLRKRLNQLVKWIHDYIGRDSSAECDYMAVNLTSHGPFYSACQAAFYVVAFRHADLVENDDVTYLRSLDMNTIITHPLNPLRVINKNVLREFARIMTFYQVAYCNNIILRNKRITLPVIGLSSAGPSTAQGKALMLDDYFPYDKYLLPKTVSLIKPLYREFQPLVNHVSDTDASSGSDSEDSIDDADKQSDCSSFTAQQKQQQHQSRRRTPSSSSRRSRTLSVTDVISQVLDTI